MLPDRFGLIAGRYLLQGQLGHGGMGRVWLARDEMLDRDVAIKEVAPPIRLGPEESEHLRTLILREARAAGRINHPNVVKIYDVIQPEEWPWLVMEYVPSVTLQRTVQDGGPMPPREVATLGLAVLQALVAAHDAGVLHRDVKPDNVLLCDDGRVVLSDFGLASLDTDGTVTRTGHLGTPQYVAPERARHGISSREADLWSFGATLYAAVEGRSPYARESVLETLTALAVAEPDPIRLAGPLAPVLSGLLRRDPAQRLGAAQVLDMLARVADGETIAPPPKAGKRWQPTALAGLGAVVIAGVAGFVFAIATRDSGIPAAANTTSPTTPPPPGIATCELAPSHAAPIPVGATGPGPYALPQGWAWFVDPVGFSLGVPEHWTYWRSGRTLCFRDPYGGRIMGVSSIPPPAEQLPGYRLVSRNEVMLRGPATEWEFTYIGAGRDRHAIALVTPGATVFWVADEFDFAPSRSQYHLVRSSFSRRPPRQGAVAALPSATAPWPTATSTPPPRRRGRRCRWWTLGR